LPGNDGQSQIRRWLKTSLECVKVKGQFKVFTRDYMMGRAPTGKTGRGLRSVRPTKWEGFSPLAQDRLGSQIRWKVKTKGDVSGKSATCQNLREGTGLAAATARSGVPLGMERFF